MTYCESTLAGGKAVLSHYAETERSGPTSEIMDLPDGYWSRGSEFQRPWALLSRRHSGFCGLNRLDESTKADHYSRKLMAPLRICQAELPRDQKGVWLICI